MFEIGDKVKYIGPPRKFFRHNEIYRVIAVSSDGKIKLQWGGRIWQHAEMFAYLDGVDEAIERLGKHEEWLRILRQLRES